MTPMMNEASKGTSPAQTADAILELESMLSEALSVAVGLPVSVSAQVAENMVTLLRLMHPGTRVYIPCPSMEERDAAIRSELRPGNAADVAAKWGLSISAVYKIANRKPS